MQTSRTLLGRKKGEKLPPLTERLKKIGLERDWDFVFHLPLRYEDETAIVLIAQLLLGQTAQIKGTVLNQQTIRTPRGEIFQVTLSDNSASIALRFLHFFPSLKNQLAIGKVIRAYGEVRPSYQGGYEMVHPKIKAYCESESTLPKALTPVYPAGEGIQQHWLRKRIARALLDVDLTDLLEPEVYSALSLPSLKEALNYLHTPPAGALIAPLMERTHPAWQRLKFDELLAQQIFLKSARLESTLSNAPRLVRLCDGLTSHFLASLPFKLTAAQTRVIKEIESNLSHPQPMTRLVQGDVGSGKTVVAATAACIAIDSGFQAALMAPTEILAEQHFLKISQWLSQLGICVAWLSGSQKAAEKRKNLELISSGQARLIVGTHALIQKNVRFKSLGLAIIDEQHRFGVSQRLALRQANDSDLSPHLLMLSATPIPRSLAMSYLADLDVSVIDELPPGRTPIQTKTLLLSRKPELVTLIRQAIDKGAQVYWICPLIDESEQLDLTAVTVAFEELREQMPEVKISLLHGDIPTEEKETIMKNFSLGLIDCLVSTTVIEVGVDVPNASIMVIEHAERFGLSQLHQLRGRIGRGDKASTCVLLFPPQLSENAKKRLNIIRQTSDGFEIARKDLEIRGPGEFLGQKQSGTPILRFADLQTDLPLLEKAKEIAEQWLKSNPTEAQKHATRWFSKQENFLNA